MTVFLVVSFKFCTFAPANKKLTPRRGLVQAVDGLTRRLLLDKAGMVHRDNNNNLNNKKNYGRNEFWWRY